MSWSSLRRGGAGSRRRWGNTICPVTSRSTRVCVMSTVLCSNGQSGINILISYNNLWAILKLLQVVNPLCKERSDNSLPPHVCAEQLANSFGEFFCRKIEVIKEDIGQCFIDPPTYSTPTPVARLERFVPVSDEEMRDIITSASRASCQLDPISIWLMKNCVQELVPVIAKMIDSSLVSGIVPNDCLSLFPSSII